MAYSGFNLFRGRLRTLPYVASSNLNWPSTRTFHTRQCGCASLVRDSAHQKKNENINFHESSEDAYCQKIPRLELLPSKKSVWLICHRGHRSLRHSIDSKSISGGNVSPTFFRYGLNPPKKPGGKIPTLPNKDFLATKYWFFVIKQVVANAKGPRSLKIWSQTYPRFMISLKRGNGSNSLEFLRHLYGPQTFEVPNWQWVTGLPNI